MDATATHAPGMGEKTAWRGLPILMALLILVAPVTNLPGFAQGLDREEAIDAIVGSDVKTAETGKEAQVDRVVTAVENAMESTQEVRKAFSLDTLEIVFVPELAGRVEEAVSEHDEEIEALRDAIEGSAMFYHAVDSRSIMLSDIIAVEFADDNTVTIFVHGKES